MSICYLDHYQGLAKPEYQTPGAAGLDLLAAVEKEINIEAGEYKLIPTGISMEIPLGFEAQVRPRSGLALKYGITVLNTPGTIDSDYRGEIKVVLINFGKECFTVTRGMRIAQLVFGQVTQAEMVEKKCLNQTIRDSGGFGHTGI